MESLIYNTSHLNTLLGFVLNLFFVQSILFIDLCMRAVRENLKSFVFQDDCYNDRKQ